MVTVHGPRAHIMAVFLILVFVGELAWSVHRQPLTWDEGNHIYAGYESWISGDFGINPEHPPLLKAIATLPLLPMHLYAPAPVSLTLSKTEAYLNGRALIYDNGGLNTANKLIFSSPDDGCPFLRWACHPGLPCLV